MSGLLISIPVHEQFAVVMDQVANVQRYNSSATVVLHVSKEFKYGLLRRARFVEADRLLINPTHMSSARQGLLPIHLSNYIYAREKGPVDAFVINASNDLYVRQGAARHIAAYDCIVRPVPLAADSDWSYAESARRHGYLQRLAEHLGGRVCASTPEGTAYPRALMDEMVDILTKRFPYEPAPNPYPDEETVLPTIAARLAARHGLPFVVSEITLGRPLERAIIDEVRAGTFRFPPKTFYGSHQTYPVYDGANVFAVKRVPRRINDPLRVYIRRLADTV